MTIENLRNIENINSRNGKRRKTESMKSTKSSKDIRISSIATTHYIEIVYAKRRLMPRMNLRE
jgi:hypothetical protein